jgi:hypothetical protein
MRQQHNGSATAGNRWSVDMRMSLRVGRRREGCSFPDLPICAQPRNVRRGWASGRLCGIPDLNDDLPKFVGVFRGLFVSGAIEPVERARSNGVRTRGRREFPACAFLAEYANTQRCNECNEKAGTNRTRHSAVRRQVTGRVIGRYFSVASKGAAGRASSREEIRRSPNEMLRMCQGESPSSLRSLDGNLKTL